MITPKDIEMKTMTEAKRNEAKHSLFAFYVGRPISYALTIPFLYTNITPNAVSIVSIIFSISGFLLVSFGQTLAVRLLGWFFFLMWNLFDGVDGNIARYKNMMSKSGDMLDTLGGYLSMVLILFSMGLAAFNENIHLPYIIAIAGLSALSTLIPRTLMHRQLAHEKGSADSASALKDKETYSLPRVIVLNICDPAGFQIVIMLIALLIRQSALFTIGYMLVNLIVMVYSIRQLMK